MENAPQRCPYCCNMQLLTAKQKLEAMGMLLRHAADNWAGWGIEKNVHEALRILFPKGLGE